MSSSTSFTITLLVCATLAVAHMDMDSLLSEVDVRSEWAKRANTTCYAYYCTKPGQSCDGEKVCIDNSTCTRNSIHSATCVKNRNKSTVDNFCYNDGDCYQPAKCVNNRCNQGTPCKIDNECFYQDARGTNFTSCLNARCAGLGEEDSCSNTSYCFPPLSCCPNNTCITPQNTGSYCDSNTDCIQSLKCINSTCASPIAVGETCDYGVNNCVGDSFCTPTNQDGSLAKCIPVYSQGEGGFCSEYRMCGEGLTCFPEDSSHVNISICKKVATTSSFKSCDLFASDPSSTCNTGEVCWCNGNNGKGICIFHSLAIHRGNPYGIKNAYDKMHNLRMHSVKDVLICAQNCLRTDHACLASQCSKQFCQYFDLFNKDSFNALDNVFPKCIVDQYYSKQYDYYYGYLTCGSPPSPSNAGHVLCSIGLVLLALMMSFMLS